jgi:DNA-binding NtrC family response regulator
MRAEDLDLRELLEFAPSGGILRFAGERALLFDAVALGLLRKELIAALGTAAARALLTRFGYAHGWRTAEMLRGTFAWDNDDEWRRAGGRLHRLQGLVLFEPVERQAGEAPRHFAQAAWHDSYEAEQHLMHLGRSEEPVCWTLCGFASGYLSASHGRAVYCVEEKCRGKGDAYCLMAGRPSEEWDDATREQFLYYEKDCLDGALKQVTEALREAERRLGERRRTLERVRVSEPVAGIVADSEAMRRVLDVARRAAQVDSTVLLTGESGVGKELIARLIHDESPRAPRPFVAVNCAALPESLLESELFGHARGAFTGASQDRVGLFEAANRGTILLDEIGDITAGLQAKLLRVLQEREVRRVGENRSRPVDVRVLAATNRDLDADVEAGRFRRDLFYRLHVIDLRIPPLRERAEDVLPLARALLAEAAQRTRCPVSGFTARAAAALLRHTWPGNVRELANVVERAVVLARGPRVDVEDLPEELQRAAPPSRSGLARTLAEVERVHTLAVLDASGGHRERAAKQLGIGVATLYRKLREWEEAPPARGRTRTRPRPRPRAGPQASPEPPPPAPSWRAW